MAFEGFDQLKQQFETHGQGHVFKFWDSLNDQEKKELFYQAQKVNFDVISRIVAQAAQQEHDVKEAVIEPFAKTADATHNIDDTKVWRDQGLTLVAENKAAVILMAGGAGTRLGYNHPKGQYDVLLPSHKSLFEIQAERLQKIRQLAAQHSGKEISEIHIGYYVMTSDGTHEETLNFWRNHNMFGLPEQDIFFFQQGVLPALDFNHKLIMENTHSLSWAANGNGGLFEGLHDSGALQDMQRRGVEYVHVFCVDNLLVRVADPLLYGFCLSHQVDCCNKTTEKTDPHEKVGVMCLRNGVAHVVEYSELPRALAEARQDNGRLQFNAANLAIHCFSLPFLLMMAERCRELPYHIARKKIPCVNEQGERVVPNAENGVKFEMFVFDCFRFASNPWAIQIYREEEFSPVKNAAGACSPATARADLSQLHSRYLTQAGATVLPAADGAENLVEISSLLTYAGEGLEVLNGKTFQAPVFISSLDA
eukprot:TRINITY_DN12121_c0_g1_i4.p1 TRINITY_DN12121_c0_g1~~TRINITY_DN12121_c0_g1_i4.p1  ORF type:complete len:498 (+),score=152.57 TRINITY_DN12121_c0_g1_i4:59-1495(+)